MTASSIDFVMSSFLCEGPVDDVAGVAKVVLEVESAVDLGRVQARGNVRVAPQQIAEFALAGDGAQRASLYELEGGLARHALALQRHHHSLAEVEALRLLQVLPHAGGV